MQQTIGERLQQARQRLGLSIEDISEKLKIRKDILSKFEANEFDTKLPQVYQRGFFRAYVKFLKLNHQALVADYEEMLGNPHRHSETSLGHLRLDPEDKTEEKSSKTVQIRTGENSAKYVKPILQFVHFRLLVIGLIIILILGLLSAFCRFIGNRYHKTKPDIQQPLLTQIIPPLSHETVVLIALDTVQVFVRQESDKQRLFAGTLNKNERHALEKSGSIQISYSEGKDLLIEYPDGSQIKPQKAGRGWMRLP